MNTPTETQVIHGNALDLPLPDESVDLIISSPPYFKLRSYRDGDEHYDGQIGSEDAPEDFLQALWAATAEMVRVLKPTGSIWINLGDSYAGSGGYNNSNIGADGRGPKSYRKRGEIEPTLTQVDAAWLAGVIDSDGSIGILCRKDRGASPQHDLSLYVGQIDRDVVDRIAELTGYDSVTFDGSRGLYRWRIGGRRAAWVLDRIWPWLRIKRRQALAGLALVDRKQKTGGESGGPRSALTADEIAHRETIRQAVMAWNQRQPHEWVPPARPPVPLPLQRISPRPKSLNMIPARYAIGCIDQLGLILRAEIIWSKPNGLPESVTDRVRRSHEQWFHFVRLPRYFSAVDEVREGVKEYGARYSDQNGHGGSLGMAAHPLGKLPGSVWTIPSEPLIIPDAVKQAKNLPDHFAAFPQEWPRRIILGWSPNGVCVVCGEGRRPVVEKGFRDRCANDQPRKYDGTVNGVGGNWTASLERQGYTEATITGYACACLIKHWDRHDAMDKAECCTTATPPTTPSVILDPFGGTGTVAGVAHALGRIGISVDLSADYCRLAQWRIFESGHFQKAYERSAAEGAVLPLVAPKDTADGKQSLFGDT